MNEINKKKEPVGQEPAHMRKKPAFKLNGRVMGRIFGYMKPFKVQLVFVAVSHPAGRQLAFLLYLLTVTDARV